ncbi:hemerythrin domain-containing protein [Rhodococcus sp. ACPA1]|uniref:hemerythrin domain-containing protein n=1 Tax=Rhodococcus sp. ACPA1 TaxID=2028572 RepID=UPI000BB11651|nr:hemerythrin domain-containing protein [Rhodococcus sp. ACPA1]PBC47168.1 hypothetical protein CJ177_43375 [Rhodococcus sp. ACPA1]
MTALVQDMIIVHRVFRREFEQTSTLVRKVQDRDTGRAGVVGEHLELLLNLLHHHHETEDELLWPRLQERLPARIESFASLESEHANLALLIARVTDGLAQWRKSADISARETLASSIDELRRPMIEHLDHEESILPVCAEALSQDEWNKLGERALGGLGVPKSLLVLAAMHEECPEEEWAQFTVLLPPPIQAAYEREAVELYAPYIERVRTA